MSEEIKQKARKEMDEFLKEKDSMHLHLYEDTLHIRRDMILKKFDSLLSQALEKRDSEWIQNITDHGRYDEEELKNIINSKY